jgi:hypothetical protein
MPHIFQTLISKAKNVMSNITDARPGSNATTYSMAEAGMGALSVFAMQDPSFLSHQERLARGTSRHNFNTLFGVASIPSPNQIRNIYDEVAIIELEPLYHNGLSALEEKGGLKQFQYFSNEHLIALDGTESHSSHNVHCINCTIKKHKEQIIYSHTVLCASIVSPDIKEAVALVPEFITPQDGHDKQDCEAAAAKRCLSKNGSLYKHLNPTILGDDLFSRQPMCEAILKAGYNFILVCKPDSHKTLYQYLSGITTDKATVKIRKNYKEYHYQYQFMNEVPIRDGDDALFVNWVEMLVSDKRTGAQVYRNSFITNKPINQDNAHKIGCAGRARWHLENENNNTLKTKGYNFEHNYGHGKKNLSNVLASLALVAFLYHTVMNIADALYIQTKKANGSRINFFNTIKVATSLLVFKSWDSMMEFLTDPPDLSTKTGAL